MGGPEQGSRIRRPNHGNSRYCPSVRLRIGVTRSSFPQKILDLPPETGTYLFKAKAFFGARRSLPKLCAFVSWAAYSTNRRNTGRNTRFHPRPSWPPGCAQHGCEVEVCGHAGPLPVGSFDLIHVHHLGRAALRLAAAHRRPSFVLTTHDP